MSESQLRLSRHAIRQYRARFHPELTEERAKKRLESLIKNAKPLKFKVEKGVR